MHTRKIIGTAVLLLLEVWLGTLNLDPWVLPVAIVVGIGLLVWTWDLLPHVGPLVHLGLTEPSGGPQELRRIQGSATLLPGQRFTLRGARSITANRPLNPEHVHFEWEPKSEITAELLEEGLHFARRKPSDDVAIHIDWELIEYDRKIDPPFPMRLLRRK